MRRLLWLIPILLCANAWGAITIVDNDSNHGHVTCTTAAATCVTPLIDTSGATLYVAVLGSKGGAGTITSTINDETNNTPSFDLWTCLTAHNDSAGHYKQICYVARPTPSPRVQFVLSKTSGYPTLMVSVWKGTDPTAAVIDVSNGNQSSSSVTSLTTGSTGTLAGTGELIISGWGSDGANTTSLAVDSGLTIQDTQTVTSSELGASAYLVASATTAINANWSVGGAGEDMAVAIAAFKPMSGTPVYVYNFGSNYAAPAAPGLVSSIATNPITEVTGNLMVCGVADYASTLSGNSSLPTGVADANNTYTDTGEHLTFNGVTNTFTMSIWYAKNITGGSSITPTATWSSAVHYGYVICHQYANVNTTAPFDSSAVASGSDTSPASSVTSGSFTTAFANDVIFAFAACDVSAVQTFTAGTNFILRGLDYNAAWTDIQQGAAVEDWIPVAIETGATAAISYTTSSDSGIVVAAFKGLGGAAVRHRAQVIQ
jgi:hypothetical protein